MAMRLYNKEELIEVAAKFGLKHVETLDHHIIFQDKHGEPFSAPCNEEGCPDYLFDLFIAKINKADSKVIGITKEYDITQSS